MTTTHTHTAATLALLPERELDALAHRIVLPDKNTMWISPTKFEFVDKIVADWEAYPSYSTDLNHAALLEQALEQSLFSRGLDTPYYDILCAVAGSIYLAITASAKSHTIAAILAAQQEAK